MCGICGVAGGEPAAGLDLVRRMCDAMAHRGPDDAGSEQLDGVPLGMRRLSIIDLAGGHQPMHNEDSTVWVVENGEVYNHRELREQLIAAGHAFMTQSDTEVLVHGYEQWGEAVVERLNGMFAFAVVDRRRCVLFLARERVGIKPLHYAIDGERLVFASEMKALLQDRALRKGIDPVALDEYLTYEFVPSPRSIVRGISKLRPGHTLTWSFATHSAAVRRYWAPELNVDGAGGERELDVDKACAELRAVLRESVRKELISDVPLGVFLSGGIDSSAVAAMMSEVGGDGGDELFAGYPTLQAHRLAGYYLRAPALLRRGLVEPLVRRLPVSRNNLSFDFRAKRFASGAGHPVAERHRRWMGSFASEERTSVLSREIRASLCDAHGRDEFSSYDPLNQVLMVDLRLYLENDILVKLDRASMMASLEGRVPLLNNDFVAYATSLPLHMKLRGMRSKFLFKRALRGVLPDRILNRPKKGFGIPVAEWFRGPLREQMLSVLSPERIAADGFFEVGGVRRLIDEHLAGRRDNRKQLWTLFAFQLWHDGYALLR